MFAIGNNELENNPRVGNYEQCPVCGEMHEVKYGYKINEDGSKTLSKNFAYVKCPKTDEAFLVGFHGRKLKT